MNKTEQIRKQIIKNLVKERNKKGISQTELAKMMDIKTANLSRIESGKQNITLDTFLKYSESIGIDPIVSVSDSSFAYVVDNKDYQLKLYDDVLLEFCYEETNKTKITKINNKLKHLLPLDLELSDKGLYEWLKKRTIPKNRTFVESILEAYGLTVDDTKGIIDVCLGLSLNDSYWVTPKDFEGSFKRYNLYENPIDEILSIVAYTGHVYTSQNRVFTTSPEFTTGGMLRKTWHKSEDGRIFLYKGGSEGFANSGREPYSEFYAYQIANRMGLDCVRYEIENYKGILASKCELFTNKDTSYIPIGNLVKSGGIDACVRYYDKLGQTFSNAIRSMLVFDALIYNEDRHFGNFGLLRDNISGEIVAPSPIFDNGMSLFCYANKDKWVKDGNLRKYAKTLKPPYDYTYKEICRKYMGNLQRSQLRRLVNFHFERKAFNDFDDERIDVIEEQLNYRINELLKLS